MHWAREDVAHEAQLRGDGWEGRGVEGGQGRRKSARELSTDCWHTGTAQRWSGV